MTATSYHVEMQHASNLAAKLNKELDYANYALTVAQQSHLPTYFSESTQLLGKQLDRTGEVAGKNATAFGYRVPSNAAHGS